MKASPSHSFLLHSLEMRPIAKTPATSGQNAAESEYFTGAVWPGAGSSFFLWPRTHVALTQSTSQRRDRDPADVRAHV